MKVLIWIGCFFGITIVNIIIGEVFGIRLGSILLYFVIFFVAKKLCEKWDYRKKSKKEGTYKSRFTECPRCGYIAVFEGECPQCKYRVSRTSGAETAMKKNRPQFCRKCGNELIENSKFCSKCGTAVIENAEG